jgi:hypothetical protein
METNELIVTAESTGIAFKVKLKSFYCNFGGSIEVTPILNSGQETEKTLPSAYSNVSVPVNGDFHQEGSFEDFIASNPAFVALVEKAITEAAAPYQS